MPFECQAIKWNGKAEKSKNTNNSNIVPVYIESMWHLGWRWIACAQVTRFHIHTSFCLYLHSGLCFSTHILRIFGTLEFSFCSCCFFFSLHCLLLLFLSFGLTGTWIFVCTQLFEWNGKKNFRKINRSVNNRKKIFRVFCTVHFEKCWSRSGDFLLKNICIWNDFYSKRHCDGSQYIEIRQKKIYFRCFLLCPHTNKHKSYNEWEDFCWQPCVLCKSKGAA